MDFTTWFTSDVCEADEEFLCDELNELKNYVLTKKKIDISAPLFLFENRVLFSKNGKKSFLSAYTEISENGTYCEKDLYGRNNNPISWDTIRKFPLGTFEGKEVYVTIEKRIAKLWFLIGWLEVKMWMRGLFKEQKYHTFSDIDKFSKAIKEDKIGLFFSGETTNFSIDSNKRFWEFYLNPDNNQKRPRLVNKKESISGINSWLVYVTPDLHNYFINNKRTKKNNLERFLPGTSTKMVTINCPKNSDSRHAAIANADSWQLFLGAAGKKEGGKMDEQLDSQKKTEKEAFNEEGHRLTQRQMDTRRIFVKRLVKNPDKYGLDLTLTKGDNYQIEISDSDERSRCVLSVINEEKNGFKICDQKIISETPKKGQTVLSRFNNLIKSITDLWIPNWAEITAEGNEEVGKHSFEMDNEEGWIHFTCHWGASEGQDPAYIYIDWEAEVAYEEMDLMGIRFLNPETHEILCEESLGKSVRGEETFTSYDLGFDPSQKKFGVSIFFHESEK